MNSREHQPHNAENILLNKYREKIYAFVKSGGNDAYTKLINFLQELKQEHTDVYDYKLYHLASGSTPPETVTKLDFPDKKIQTGLDELLASEQK